MKRRTLKRTRLKRNTEKAKKFLWRAKLTAFLRRKSLAKRGRKYREKREKNFGEKADFVRELPCLVCERTPCEPHHEPPRSRGGTSESLTPLCYAHHQMRHFLGSAELFWRSYHVDLVAEAARIEKEWGEAA